MQNELNKKAEKIQKILNNYGYELKVVELSDSTRTSLEAAEAIGCKIEQIAKSIIFKLKSNSKPILIIASGINRVNEKTLKEIVGEKPEKANADFILEQTGYVIGGIPPVGHINQIETFIDEDLFNYDEIWAAAGTPHAVFKLTPRILLEITNGKIISIK